MTCTEARSAMLEADPDELRRAADTPLSSHLRTCNACRTAAERIVQLEGAMGRRIAVLAPRRGIGRAPAAPLPRRRPWRWVVPLAAAAGVGTLLLVVTRPPGPRAVEDRPAGVARRGAEGVSIAGPGGVSVRAPAGRNVAVFQTDNPDIVVIWFY